MLLILIWYNNREDKNWINKVKWNYQSGSCKLDKNGKTWQKKKRSLFMNLNEKIDKDFLIITPI